MADAPSETIAQVSARSGVGTRARGMVFLWVLFVLICFGLGYPTLNRYDARKALPDAAVYARLATEGPQSVANHFRFRVLIPFLVRPVCALVKGHLASWDPLAFGFLVVNSWFAASTALLLFALGRELAAASTALLASTLYLLNFAVANAHLAGLVDAGEACFLMALMFSMFHQRWALLPVCGVFGTLTKESFVPFSLVMAVSWWLAIPKRADYARRAGCWVASLIAAELIVFTALHLALGERAAPWNFALTLNSRTSYAANFLHSLVDRNSWYVLVWLLPLGLRRIRRFPSEWVLASAAGCAAALLLNAYHSTVGGGGGGIGRYVFNIAGPLLSLSAASFLSDLSADYTAIARNRSRM